MSNVTDPKALIAKYRLDSDSRLDADQRVFFSRQLEEIDAKLYDKKYAKLEAFELMSVKTLSAGAESYTYRIYDSSGKAVMSSDYANGSPRVDVGGSEHTTLIRSVRASFGYSIQEIRAAQMAGLPLESMRAMAARRAIDEKLNKVALLGDSEFGLTGLFNNASIPLVSAGTGGTGSPNTLWTGKTADQIAQDLFALIDSIPTATHEVEKANRVLLPYSRFRLISAKPYTVGGAVTGETVLQFVQRNRPGVEIRGALHLDTASAGGACRAMAYDASEEKLQLVCPIPFETFAPQAVGMESVVECHARIGSACVRYPLSAAYMDAI